MMMKKILLNTVAFLAIILNTLFFGFLCWGLFNATTIYVTALVIFTISGFLFIGSLVFIIQNLIKRRSVVLWAICLLIMIVVFAYVIYETWSDATFDHCITKYSFYSRELQECRDDYTFDDWWSKTRALTIGSAPKNDSAGFGWTHESF